jgi:hypothetical protein
MSLSIGSADARPGDDVQLLVSVTEVTGSFSLTLPITFPDELTFLGVTNASTLPDGGENPASLFNQFKEADPNFTYWASPDAYEVRYTGSATATVTAVIDDSVTRSGDALALIFEVAESAEPNNKPVVAVEPSIDDTVLSPATGAVHVVPLPGALWLLAGALAALPIQGRGRRSNAQW